MRDSNSLRLRLVVRRHSLPDVRVVFPIQLDNEPTIANLLEQVNDLIPLESSDWGLEDYAVELRDYEGHAFDCLHFQRVSSVLKSDEEVFIRPLDTGDHRRRRLSGRHQISSDGKRLIDGVAFGRPRLKTPRDRPPVDIPPLKRRRVAYETEEHEDQEPQLLLTQHGEEGRIGRRVRFRAGPGDIDGAGSEADEDYQDRGSVEEDTDQDSDALGEEELGDSDDMEDELRDLQEDTDRVVGGNPSTNNDVEDATADQSDADSVASIVKHYDQHGFPSGSVLAGTAAAQMVASMRKAGVSVKAPVHTRFEHPGAPAEDPHASSSESDSDGEDSSSDGDDGPEVAPSRIPVTLRGVRLDGYTRSSGSVASDAKSASGAGNHTDSDSDSEDDSDEDDSESDASSESDSDSASDSDDDGGESGDGDGNDAAPGSDSARDVSDNLSSSSGDESDESDSSVDDGASEGAVADVSRQSPVQGKTIAATRSSTLEEQTSRASEPERLSSEAQSGLAVTTTPVPPGQGKTATQRRNARRRAALKGAKAAIRDENRLADALTPKPALAGHSTDLLESIAAKKATLLRNIRLLRSIPSDGTAGSNGTNAGAKHAFTVPPHLSSGVAPDTSALPVLGSADPYAAAIRAQKNLGLEASATRLVSPQSSWLEKQGNTAPESCAPVPLAGSVQPLAGCRPRVPADDLTQLPEDEEEREGLWRDKISYRAVECCQEGVNLSEPPFPFVQRWDPQQQYYGRDRTQRGGRSKRKQRNQEGFFNDGSRTSAKRRKFGPGDDSLDYEADDGTIQRHSNHGDDRGVGDTVLNYDDEPDDASGHADQIPSPSAEEDDDLPPLPDDVSALSALGPSEAVPGMILTWRQWLLSKATNWQPQVSVLTGLVVDVFDDQTLKVRLAKRDRKLDRNERVYDDDGNRVYDKFELPGMEDEEEEAAEEGYRILNLVDMIEPRILQHSSQAQKTLASEDTDEAISGIVDTTGQVGLNVLEGVLPALVDAADSEAIAGDHQADVQEGGHARIGSGSRNIMISDLSAEPKSIGASIAEDRRHEISLLISTAGFRKDVDPAVADKPCLDLSSPSRQLEETTQGTAPPALEILRPESRDISQSHSQGISDNDESQPVFLEPFHGFSDAVSEPPEAGQVAYPKLDLLPSETGSLHSVRQADADFSIDLGHDSFQDAENPASVSRSTLGRESGDKQGSSGEASNPDSGADSDSSGLSLSDLWVSASANGSRPPTKHAVLSALKARKTDVDPDPEYEAVVRRLDTSDDMSDEDVASQHHYRSKNAIQGLGSKPGELRMPGGKGQTETCSTSPAPPHIKSERASPKPAAPAASKERGGARSNGTPFVVPGSSQVVSLLSSSPEPDLEEHYAEDSIDETYEEPSLPSGSGWAKKTRVRRHMSVPAPSGGPDTTLRKLASSQTAKPTSDKRSSSVLASLLRGKRKALANKFQ